MNRIGPDGIDAKRLIDNSVMQNGLKLIALIKTIRGFGALSLAASLFWGSQQNLSQISEKLANYEFLAMISRLIGVTLAWLSSLPNNDLLSLSILALLFSVMRFGEAVGIWFNQSWAEWLAVSTGSVTAIFFIHRLIDGIEWTIAIFLIVNILVVIYLLKILLTKRCRLAK